MVNFLSEETIERVIGNDPRLVQTWLKEALYKHYTKEFVQPTKTYLQITDNAYDRAIALPAYLKGDDGVAGIKWIGSHSKNVSKGLQRANALIILNNPDTMVPEVVMDGSLISTMRTFGMTLIALDKFMKPGASIGIIGMGKLGQLHVKELANLYPDIEEIYCFSHSADIDEFSKYPKVKPTKDLQELLDNSDVLITTSRAQTPYISESNLNDRTNLIVNISLMDFELDVIKNSAHIIVDDWEQNKLAKKVFREGVENGDLTRENVTEVSELLFGLPREYKGRVFLNPLGMGIEDIYVAQKTYKEAPKFNFTPRNKNSLNL